MDYVIFASPEIATARMEEAGILLLDKEISSTPLTITIFGKRNVTVTNQFLEIAHRNPSWYKLIKHIPDETTSAVIEIDTIKSKPVSSPEKLKEILQNY